MWGINVTTNIEALKVFADFEDKLLRSLFALRKIIVWSVRLGQRQ